MITPQMLATLKGIADRQGEIDSREQLENWHSSGRAQIDVYDSFANGPYVTVHYVFGHLIWSHAQSGSDWGHYYIHRGTAVFRGDALVGDRHERRVCDYISEGEDPAYDYRAHDRIVCEQAMAELVALQAIADRQLAADQLPGAVRKRPSVEILAVDTGQGPLTRNSSRPPPTTLVVQFLFDFIDASYHFLYSGTARFEHGVLVDSTLAEPRKVLVEDRAYADYDAAGALARYRAESLASASQSQSQ